MSCGFQEELTAYVDRELPPLKLLQVQNHLPGCAECSKTVEEISHALSALQALPAYQPSQSLRRQVLAAIQTSPTLLERLSGLLTPKVLIPALSAGAALVVAVAALKTGSPAADGANPVFVADASELELVQNLEVMEDLDVLGLESPEDLEVVERLEELEGQP